MRLAHKKNLLRTRKISRDFARWDEISSARGSTRLSPIASERIR